MLPKNQRIPRNMFPNLSKGKVLSGGGFLLRFVSVSTKEKRFCFSVSKKISKNAVVRNKIRRSGYRVIKPLIPLIKNGTMVVFSFKKAPNSDKDLERDIKNILKEANLIS